MNDIKVTSKHNGTVTTYADAAGRHEITICHIGNYYSGWYYVEEEENSYQGKMAEGESLEMVIAMLALFAGMDNFLNYSRAEEIVDLLKKVQAVYPQN